MVNVMAVFCLSSFHPVAVKQCDDRQPEVCCYNKQHKRKILSNQESS